MYIPASFRVSEEATTFSFLARYDFGTIVTSSASNGIIATHVPILVKQVGDCAVIQGPYHRANGHWREFDGPQRRSRFSKVRMGSFANLVHDRTCCSNLELRGGPHIRSAPRDRGSQSGFGYLGGLSTNMRVTVRARDRTEELPENFYEQMLSRIVAFEMPIDKIESKFKLGQNRSKEDREGTLNGLIAEGSPSAAALAAFMREHETWTPGV